MNTGLQDAYNLAWKLAATIKGVVTPAVLDSYAHERHAVGKQVLRMTDTMTRGLELRSPVASAIRNLVISTLASTEIFQHAAGRQMSEIDVKFRDSPIVSEYHEGIFSALADFGGPRAGDRAPDAEGLQVAGTSRRLFDLLHGDQHKLLLFAAGTDAEELAQLGSIARQVAARYGKQITTYSVTTTGGPTLFPASRETPSSTVPARSIARITRQARVCTSFVPTATSRTGRSRPTRATCRSSSRGFSCSSVAQAGRFDQDPPARHPCER